MNYRQKQLLEEAKEVDESRKKTTEKVNTVNKWLSTLGKEASRLEAKDPEALKKLGLNAKQIKDLSADTKERTPDEWRLIKRVREEVKKQTEHLRKDFCPKKMENYIKKNRKQCEQRYGSRAMFIRKTWMTI